jgi:hypothetical protein
VVAAELVNEHDRRAGAGLLVVKLDAVVRGELGHVAFYGDESRSLQAVRAAGYAHVRRVAFAPGLERAKVVVSVKAASVNFPDVLIIQNKYQFKPPLPFSPGSELAGVVKEVGAGVTNVKAGDKVIAFTTYGAFAER